MIIRKNSFTLIELLIVLVIIGIIATLAAPQYENYVNRAKCVEAKLMLRAWSDSIWRYYVEAGAFSTDANSLDVKVPPSKYFTYFLHSSGRMVLGQTKLKNSNGYSYRSYYIYYLPNPVDPAWHPQAMDANWSKVYTHVVYDGPTIYEWD